ncbi:MAG: ACT domain-containing protein [Pseudomonadota bacterium]
MSGPVRDTEAMIAGMAPELLAGEVAFVSLPAPEAAAYMAEARAAIREAEGVTLILPRTHAAVPEDALALRQITLRVHSALDGVGLTAAVAGALAAAQIPCNVVAGFHHDHIFVPASEAERAVTVLRDRAQA